MDGFHKAVIVTILITLLSMGIIFSLALYDISKGNIPDEQSGLVISKQPISNGKPANYTVTLSDNRVLYIAKNSALYESIVENQTYVFHCSLDVKNKMTFIQQVSEK